MHIIIGLLVLGFILAWAWELLLALRLRGVLLIAGIVLAYVSIFYVVDHGPIWLVWILAMALLAGFIGLIGLAVYLLFVNRQSIIAKIW